MRRLLALSLITLLATAVTASAAQTNATVKAALARELPSLNLSNVSFGDAIDFVRDLTNLNINVHWKELELLHVTKETPVNVRLRSISTRKALELILAEAGAGTPLTYYIDEGVIEITTREAADARMITRVYDVGDLTLDIPDFEGRSMSLTEGNGASGGSGRGGGRGGGGGGSGGGLFSGSGGGSSTSQEKTKSRDERGEELVKLITSTIRPEIWADAGGTAQIRYFHGRIIVTAPRSVQEMIGGSLD
jgi:uncharacterized membrane protein YgcG